MLVRPGVQVKPVESDPPHADRYLGELRPHLGVEPVAVHAEIARRVAVADEAGEKGDSSHGLPYWRD